MLLDETSQSLSRIDLGSAIPSLIAARRTGWSLPQPFYVDPLLFAADVHRVWRHSWLFVGHSVEAPKPGDFFTFELGDDSIILMRGDDLRLTALFNVCRHRGSRLCTSPSGHVGRLVCPYHQWAYDRRGTLVNAKFMGDDFDRSDFSLERAAVREVEGLVFINLSDHPDDFAPAELAIREQLRPHGLERAKIAQLEQYDIQANWKLVFENNRECYHCPVGHPQYCLANPGGNDHLFPQQAEELRAHERAKRDDWQRIGLCTENTSFAQTGWFSVRRMALRPGFVTESLDGRPVAPLMGDFTERNVGSFRVIMFPNIWLQASGDYCMTTSLTPISATRTRARVAYLVHGDAREGIDYDLSRLTALWKATSEQDWKLCENNQAGVNSSRYQPGPYSPELEEDIEQLIKWYFAKVSAP